MWFGANSSRNFRAHVPAHERQSISRGELRGVLHAMLSRATGERMVVVVDSKYVFKAITVWTEKWKRHGWRTSSGEVGHRDLWEHIDWLRGEAGDKLQVRWVPSHLGVTGNEAADELAGQGRELHAYNLLPFCKRRRVTEWDALGLEPMAEVSDLDLGSEGDSGGTLGGSSTASSTSGDEDFPLSSSDEGSFSMDVSGTRLRGAWDSDSDESSTDVSESRKRRRGGGVEFSDGGGASGASGVLRHNRGGAYLKDAWLPRHAMFGGEGGGHAAGDRPSRLIRLLKVCTKCKPQVQPLGPRGRG